MPSNLLNADTGFPQFTPETSDKEKIEKITSYLFMLLEQLRYSLTNLDRDNFNDTGFDEITNFITEPLYIQLADDDQRITALHITAQGLTSRISDAEGNISALTLTAQSLASRISDAEGNVSSLQQTAVSLTSRISDAEGNISSVQQTVNGLSLSVTNGSSSSTIKLMSNGVALSSKTISFSGMVTFSDLSTSGWTTINGDNITTGTIEAIDIYGCYIESCTFETSDDGFGMTIGGRSIKMKNGGTVWGGIGIDDWGHMSMWTRGSYSIYISADSWLYLYADYRMEIEAPRIDINGDVYINGTKIE